MTRLSDALDRLGIVLACLAGVAVLVLQVAEILLRLVGVSIVFSVDLAGFLMIAIIFFGLSEVTRRRDHIQANFFVLMLPAHWQHRMDYLFNTVLMAVYVAALIWIVGGLAWSSWDDTVRSDGIMQLPLVIPQGLMAAGLAAMLLRLFCDMRAGPRTRPSTGDAGGV